MTRLLTLSSSGTMVSAVWSFGRIGLSCFVKVRASIVPASCLGQSKTGPKRVSARRLGCGVAVHKVGVPRGTLRDEILAQHDEPATVRVHQRVRGGPAKRRGNIRGS